jgi:AcrR family transcriptional regulator
MRADARRNREAMLAAARRVFAEGGIDAPLDAIAREAGVARATQHRHFPTRERLIEALLHENLDEVERVAEAVADPADAYVETLCAAARLVARDRGLNELFGRPEIAPATRTELRARITGILAEPLAAAQAAGRVRADLEAGDALALVGMLSTAYGIAALGEDTPRLSDRAVAFVLETLAPR